MAYNYDTNYTNLQYKNYNKKQNKNININKNNDDNMYFFIINK